MKNQIKKQEIDQLFSKFMAGETSVAEEGMLAQYFRTHEVGEEWTEYKEMFALFDNGQVDIEPEADTSDNICGTDSAKIQMLPKAVKGKPKIAALRWLMAGIAASLVLLVVFHLGRSTAEQPTLVAEKTIVTKDSVQPRHEAIIPTEKTEAVHIAQATSAKSRMPHAKVEPTVAPKANSVSSAEDLANCIARLEAEMDNLDDSVNSQQVEKLIAADVRLQQMVNRIVGKQVEQAINEFKKDSTANYINF